MNTLLVFIASLLVVTQVAAFIACPPHYCQTTTCTPLTEETCTGKIVPNGGFCGCCDGCYAVIQAGGFCGALFPAVGGLGHHVVCVDGYFCNPDTNKCESPVEN
ncbi:hypothetical protein BsWGS_04712 [Bradybaena similaris]